MFDGWVSGQTWDQRVEIGLGFCLLALSGGGGKLGKHPDAIPISFSAKHEIKAIYSLADNYIILIPS